MSDKKQKNTMFNNEQSNRYFGKMDTGVFGTGFIGMDEEMLEESKTVKPLFPTYNEIVR